MKTKTVKRHWCDFCNKAGLQERAMARHEKHGTRNADQRFVTAAQILLLIQQERLDQKFLRA